MFYNKKEKNNYKLVLEELKLDLIEIQAYRNLDYKSCDFGFKYDMKEDTSYIGSEDAHYEMAEQYISDAIQGLKYNYSNSCFLKNQKKTKLNRYYKKQCTKEKLKKLLNNHSRYYSIYDNGVYIERSYLSAHNGNKVSRTKFYKRISNKKIRKSKDFKLIGKNYKKNFDYWCKID